MRAARRTRQDKEPSDGCPRAVVQRTARRGRADRPKCDRSQRGGEAWAYVDSAVRAGSSLDIFKTTPQGFGEHVAQHDPARVLREIDVKRKLLAPDAEHERIDRETIEAESEHARPLVSLRP
ncbi:DUF6221 family protein [Streptomyces sp. A475]|uniref:DUF6221 family protein n=1 Tax=Streptomyces sp. A475 TaxID=3131976 RepID=UPI0030C96374